MPRWNGRISSNAQNRRNNYVPRRPLSERNNNCPVEQRLTSTLILNNTDQRCIIFTLVSPEIDDYFKLAAFIQSLSYSSQRKDTQPAPLPPAPPITLLFNLQKENNTEISENTCPPNPSQMDIMSRSRNRNKRTKSFKDLSGSSSHRYLAVDNSSSSPCDSLSPISSDDLVSDITTVDRKPLKRNSKKKGKKKGKHYKASPYKKDSSELSEDAKLPPILNKDTINKMEGGNVSNITESSETMVSSTSNNDDEFSKSSANVLEIDSDHRQYNPSKSNVVTIESDIRESYYSEGVFHAHSSTERSQNSIEACSSNDFQPVISCKRGRSSRKLTNYSGKDSTNCSVWQKVQKDNVSSKVAASSKGSSFNFNQKLKPVVGEPAKSSVTSVNKKQADNYLRKGPLMGNTNHVRSSKTDIQQKPASNNLSIDAVKSSENLINEAKSSRNSQKQIDVKMHNVDVDANGFGSTSSDLQCNSNNQSKVAEYIVIESRSEPELQKVAPQENPEAFTSSPIIDDSKSNIMLDTKSSESEAIAIGMQGSSRSGDDADCSSSETDISSGSYLDASLSMILNASTDSYRLQTVTSIHMADGSPLAEFERFMLSATPVINGRHHIDSSISLASVWQWYEEPGCFGLEVKAKDMYKYNRLPDSSLEFSAYFVPFLSAVQLFSKACEDVSVSSSNLSSLPILSALLPRRGNSASAKDVELIFEYFEHAQPPQRQPLFEKIKELVSDEGTSNMNMYGNPSALECLNLCDLHPASWYAVAWYPICRIPDGNFRAAFLTYHSLGHFDKQSGSSKTTDEDFSGIISPVIGLQSYNAKKECWFQPRSMNTTKSEKEEVSSSSRKLLEERLQMLEKTASILATATICKGTEKSINNHPDYTHFFSRW